MYSGNFKRDGSGGSGGGSRGGSRPPFGGGSRFSKSPTARPASGHAPYHSHPSSGSAGGFSRGQSRGGSYGNRSGGRFGGPPQRSFGRAGGKRFGRPAGQRIDISKFISKAVVTTEAVTQFVPEHKFGDFQVDERLKANILIKGYSLPTPIKGRIIPYILKGSDVVGIANTGTGKTAAFLVPLINKVLLSPIEQVLIVVPTRELALQIQDELKGFTKQMKVFSVCCVGGASIGRQISELRYKNNFIIGTPGRLKDLIERKNINLSKFNTIVLDEADRMLDMGFVNDMRFMMSRMPRPRHTLFFSATMSREIDGLIKEFLHEPVSVSVKTQDTSKNVDQDIIRIAQNTTKIDVLYDLLIKPEFAKVLVFGRTKHGVEKLSRVLEERGFKVASIHGNKNQSGRQRALAAFKEGKLQILVATSRAAP